MKLPPALHRWDLPPDQARALQSELAGQVETTDRLPPRIHRVAGIDVGFEDGGQVTRAAVAVLAADTLEPLELSLARSPTRFPYVPGLLSFRECPAILRALEQLREAPDLLLCDGQGRAHPRHLGIASHLGLITDLPSIGVGKSRLVGEYQPVAEARGARQPLRYRGETVGWVLRTRTGVRPLFVSPGHRVSLDTAAAWVLRCTTRYRLPETTRWADALASRRPWLRRALAAHPIPVAGSKTGPDML